MLRRRVNREVKKYRGEFFSAVPLRLTLLFILLSNIVLSQTNNQQYELNDPRNPDCPCHKLQKLAEDEYKQLQMQNNTDQQLALNINKQNPINNNNNSINDNGIDQQSRKGNDNFGQSSQKASIGTATSGERKKKKSLLWLVQKKRNVFRIKYSRIKKFRINDSECFHWD